MTDKMNPAPKVCTTSEALAIIERWQRDGEGLRGCVIEVEHGGWSAPYRVTLTQRHRDGSGDFYNARGADLAATLLTAARAASIPGAH